MKKAMLILALLIVTAIVAESAEWVFIGKLTDENSIYIDTSSIRKVSGNRRVWVKYDWKEKSSANSGVDYILNLEEFDCSEGKFRIIQQKIMENDGTRGFTPSNEGPWEFIEPDSSHEVILKYICK